MCNSYDSYTLEEDGRLEVQITQEYGELNLSNPPSITRVESTIEALKLIEGGDEFDLVITMYNVGEMDVYTFSHEMKRICPKTPVVLLTNFSKEIYRQIEQADTSDLDYVFCWNNSTDLIIAIIKLIEDSMNADHDILEFGVQTILLVEDTPFLVLDEGTSALDQQTAEEIESELMAISDLTLLTITHNLRKVEEYDSIFEMNTLNIVGA